jgi:hypothetical protein
MERCGVLASSLPSSIVDFLKGNLQGNQAAIVRALHCRILQSPPARTLRWDVMEESEK